LTKHLRLSVGSKWKRFYIRGKVPENIESEYFLIPIKAGGEKQRIWFANMKLFDYGEKIKLKKLPVSRYTYEGRDLSAKWRAVAKHRIDRIRKRDVQLTFSDKNALTMMGALVKVRLKRHAFQFGVAVEAWKLSKQLNPGGYEKYRNGVKYFSALSFPNIMKWHPWAGEWGEKFSRKNALEMLQWVKNQRLPFRGHCMVWPRKSSMPTEMQNLLEAKIPDKMKIKQKIFEHIENIGKATAFWMDEWDVLNESISCHDIQDICGQRIMVNWFQKAKKVLPRHVKLALNEYGILSSLSDNDKITKFEERVNYLLKAGTPLNVLGFQSHMGGAPPSIKRIFTTLNRFAAFKLKLRATEYDMNSDDESLLYDFTRDFYTIMFSHPAVIGIQMWTMDNMYDENGNLTSCGKAYRDTVLSQWKILKKGKASQRGVFKFRGFYGIYVVNVKYKGFEYEREFALKKGKGPAKITFRL